jgi:hypothetical protein
MLHTRLMVIREATEVVLRHLERMPPSDGTERLCASVQGCMQEIEMWCMSLPTGRDLDVLMKRVLALRAELRNLNPQTSLA